MVILQKKECCLTQRFRTCLEHQITCASTPTTNRTLLSIALRKLMVRHRVTTTQKLTRNVLIMLLSMKLIRSSPHKFVSSANRLNRMTVLLGLPKKKTITTKASTTGTPGIVSGLTTSRSFVSLNVGRILNTSSRTPPKYRITGSLLSMRIVSVLLTTPVIQSVWRFTAKIPVT
ncbi:hypothetical protein D3C76_271280 [compost metagenome]